jgi:calcineurin-like phosphoesterase family protein
MTIYAISDTHFGHEKLVQLTGRPVDFGERILSSVRKIQGDILIHCGDFCIGNETKPNKNYHKESHAKKTAGY